MITSFAHSEVLVHGNEALLGLKAAVVMAHVFEDGKGLATFAYPPVDFENAFDFDAEVALSIEKFVGASTVLVAGAFAVVIFFCRRLMKEQQALRSQAREPSRGIAMQSLPSSGTAAGDTEASVGSAREPPPRASALEGRPSFLRNKPGAQAVRGSDSSDGD